MRASLTTKKSDTELRSSAVRDSGLGARRALLERVFFGVWFSARVEASGGVASSPCISAARTLGGAFRTSGRLYEAFIVA